MNSLTPIPASSPGCHTARPARRIGSFAVLIIGALIANSLPAATVTWGGSAGTGAWSTGPNWDTGSLPTTADIATFDAADANSQFTLTLGANRTVTGVSFAATGSNGFTFNSGNQLTVNGSGITNNNAATQTFNADVRIAANQTWAATTGDLDFNNVLIARNLILTGANNFDIGGTLTSQANRSITNNGTGTFTINNIDLTANSSRLLSITGSNDTTISGLISNAGRLRKQGSGTLTISGANTYTGDTLLNGGTVVIGDNDAFGTSRIDFANSTIEGGGSARNLSNESRLTGSLLFGGTDDIELGGNMTLLNNRNIFANGTGSYEISGDIALSNNTTNRALTVRGANDLEISGDISNGTSATAGGLRKNDAGTLTLSGTNTYDGITNIIAGTVIITGDNSGLSGQFRLSNGDVVVGAADAFGTGELLLVNGDISGDGTARTISNDIITLASNGTIIEGNSDLEFTGAMTLFNGNRTLTVNNTGATTFGDIALSNNTSNRRLTLNGSGNTMVSGDITNGVGGATTALITINNTGTTTLEGNNSYGGVTDVNAGRLILNGTNTTTGNFRLDGGTTQVGNNAALGSSLVQISNGNLQSDGTPRTIANDVQLIGNGGEITGSSDLTLTGSLILNNNSRTLEVTNTGETTFGAVNLTGNRVLTLNVATTAIIDGVASGSGGSGGIIKTGAGNLSLANTNTYSGNTTVVAGTLTLSADDALGSGSTTIASGATLALTGGITVDQTSTTLAGTGVGGDGAIRNLTGDNRLTGDFSLSGATTLQSDAGTLNLGSTSLDGDGYYVDVLTNNGHTLTVTGAGDTNLFSGLSGTGNLVKNDAGILTVTGVIDERFEDRFTGEVIINDGELIQATFNNDAPGVGPLDDFGINNDITIGDGTGAASSATLTIGTNEAGGTFDFANVIGENVNLTVNADGTLQTQGHVQYVQAVTLDGGSISTEYNSGANEGTLFITGGITSTSTTQVATIDGEISLNNDPAKTIDVATGSTLDIEARIVDGGFEKTGDGTLVLSGANTFVGAVDIANGIGRVESNLGLGGTSGVGTTNVDSGAQLQLAGVAIAHEALTLNGVGISSDGALQTATSSGTNSWGGSVTIASASEIQTNTGSTLAISGNIIGSGQTLTVDSIGETTFSGTNTLNTLNKTGAGNLTVTTGTNTISTVNVNAGTFTLGTSNILADSLDLNVAGGTFSMASGITETINQLNVSGTGDLNVDGVLTMNGGTLSGGDGAGSTGTLRLTAGNTLNITNDFDFGGTLELTAGTTLALSGGHTFNLENLNVTGNTVIDFGSADANTLNLGSLTIGAGVTITVNNWASFQDLWTTGSFSGGTGAVTIDERDGNTAQITFTGFSPADTIWLTSDFGSNEITVPEPSSYGAILMGFGLIAWTLRRPRRVRHA